MSAKRAIVKTFKNIGVTTEPMGVQPAKVDGNMGADIIGDMSEIDVVDQIAFQVRWTSASAVGTIAIQGSVDGKEWDDITFDTPLTQPNSDNGGYLINMALIPFTYIRPVYRRASGTGRLTITQSHKGV